MRFATVAQRDQTRLGLVGGDGRISLTDPAFADLGAALRAHGAGLPQVVGTARDAILDPDTVEWRPPVLSPGTVLCVALNNSANPARIMSGPQHPALFAKPSSSLIGHGQPIRLRPDFGRVHPEPELAVVIGTGGNDIDADDAMAHVFGYTIFNDVTSPTMRGEDTFHYRAIHPGQGDPGRTEYVESWVTYPGRYKGTDTFGPIGPVVVTRDEVPDPHDLTIRCVHQGRVITEDSTANLRFSVAQVISFASSYLTLRAGDIIAMGTALKAAGSGQAVQNLDLNLLGGPIEVSIEGLGALVNTVEQR